MVLSLTNVAKTTAISSVFLFGGGLIATNVGYKHNQNDVVIAGIAMLVIASLGVIFSLLYLCVPNERKQVFPNLADA